MGRKKESKWVFFINDYAKTFMAAKIKAEGRTVQDRLELRGPVRFREGQAFDREEAWAEIIRLTESESVDRVVCTTGQMNKIVDSAVNFRDLEVGKRLFFDGESEFSIAKEMGLTIHKVRNSIARCVMNAMSELEAWKK